jgi:hypothetical protein
MCGKTASVFKVGSLEVRNDFAVSARLYFLCDEHKDAPDFEKPYVEKWGNL